VARPRGAGAAGDKKGRGQRQIDLAQRTSIDASTLSRLIKTVQALGYVTRARSRASGRESRSR